VSRAARRCFTVLGLLALATGASAAPAPPSPAGAKSDDLATLLARFAKSPGIFARFREEKHLAMLQAPLVNEGTIHFAPPGRLARHTTRPIASSLLIADNRVQFSDGTTGDSVDLGTNPVARAFVESFVMLLAGDRAGLERYFSLRFSTAPIGAGHGAGWRLSLTPRTSPMNKVIKEMTLAGEGLVVRTLEVRESNGDWTRTTFTEVDVDHRYSPAEQAQVFRVTH
jgi:hypothetical protein